VKNIRNIVSLILLLGSLNATISGAQAASGNAEQTTTEKLTVEKVSATSTSSDSVMAEFTQQAKSYEKLFQDGNAEALANLWTNDGMLETYDGQIFRGTQQLKDYFTKDFAKYSSRAMTVNITDLQSPTPGVVVEKGTTAVSGKAPSSKYTALHVKTDNGWKMSWVMETQLQDNDVESIKALSWLSGKWKSVVKQGDTIEIQAKWIENGGFLECTTFDTEAKAEVRQIIGYNPMLGTLVSWHFAPNGGFGQGEWARIPDGWRQRSSGVSRDGIRTYATYTLKPRTKDSFTWQSTERSINGVSVPDSGILVLNRVSE